MASPNLTAATFRRRRDAAMQSWQDVRENKQVRRVALMTFFSIQIFAITFLQKFAFNVDFNNFGVNLSLGSVELALPILYLSLFVVSLFVRLQLDLIRLGVFVIFLIFATFSILQLTSTYSVNSIMLTLALYMPFVLFIEVSSETFLKLMNIFCNFMVFFAALVLLQQAIQYTISPKLWPNLDHIIPEDFRLWGYNYIQPIAFGDRHMKPNAIFFLEVSLLSQWTAIALALEVIYFQRLWRLVLYSVTLLACFAGTGVLLIALSAPFLLARLSKRGYTLILVAIAAGFFISAKIHWVDKVQQRFGEYQVTGKSANHRFVEPMLILMDLTKDPNSILGGEGPGSGTKTNSAMWWVSTKLAYEYGFATCVSFLLFLGVFLFRKAMSLRMAFVLFIFFNTMGGFIIPCYTILLFVMGGLFVPRGAAAEPDPLKGPLLRKLIARIPWLTKADTIKKRRRSQHPKRKRRSS